MVEETTTKPVVHESSKIGQVASFLMSRIKHTDESTTSVRNNTRDGLSVAGKAQGCGDGNVTKNTDNGDRVIEANTDTAVLYNTSNTTTAANNTHTTSSTAPIIESTADDNSMLKGTTSNITTTNTHTGLHSNTTINASKRGELPSPQPSNDNENNNTGLPEQRTSSFQNNNNNNEHDKNIEREESDDLTTNVSNNNHLLNGVVIEPTISTVVVATTNLVNSVKVEPLSYINNETGDNENNIHDICRDGTSDNRQIDTEPSKDDKDVIPAAVSEIQHVNLRRSLHCNPKIASTSSSFSSATTRARHQRTSPLKMTANASSPPPQTSCTSIIASSSKSHPSPPLPPFVAAL